MPFIVELLKQLASTEQLIPVYERAKEKSIELSNKKKEKQSEKWYFMSGNLRNKLFHLLQLS